VSPAADDEHPNPELADELLAIAVDAARAAGRLLAEGRSRQRIAIDTKSSATDMVTEMDRAAEQLVLDTILRTRPDDAVLGEEGGHAAGTSGVRWIVDPLDGTTNYLYGYPAFSVSIAAEVEEVIVAGVVFDPTRDETFTALRGRGAWCNGDALRVVGQPTLATALVATGFAYVSERRAWQAEVVGRVLPAARDIRRSGSAALDLCWLAAGRVDAYYEWGLQPWDVAAGGLVAAEAGASVTTLAGASSPTDTTVAAPPQLLEDLLALLRSAQPKKAPATS
jgi:myo-inositol-1(or 4)-monophosphatase